MGWPWSSSKRDIDLPNESGRRDRRLPPDKDEQAKAIMAGFDKLEAVRKALAERTKEKR